MPGENVDEQEAQPPKTPQSLVIEEHVKIALAAQCGPDAILKGWNVHDFANKGDNYACIVSSVIVTYLKNQQKHWTSFIVKLNPCRLFKSLDDMTNLMFEKEGHFYTKIIPELNKCLKNVGQTNLKVPKCYYIHLEVDNEVIYLEDLRDEGFKMADRKKGLDIPHLLLVLNELGRLHASSIFFKGSKSKETLLEEHPCLREMFASEKMVSSPEMQQFCKCIMDGAADMLKVVDGYEEVAERIKKLDFFDNLLKELESESPFEVICHGDCWTNNFLFK